MYVGGEVAYGGRDALVEGAAEGEMAAETHTRCADAAGAGWEREEGGDGEGGVFVVGVDFLKKETKNSKVRVVAYVAETGWWCDGVHGDLFNFILVALVGARTVVGEGFWAGEFVVGGRSCDYVAVAGYLAGEAGDGAGDYGDGSIGGLDDERKGSAP